MTEVRAKRRRLDMAVLLILASIAVGAGSESAFSGMMYLTLFNKSVTWLEASHVCGVRGERLLGMDNLAELQAAKLMLDDIRPLLPSAIGDFWVDLLQISPDSGHFLSSACHSMNLSDRWASGEPNDLATDHCVRIVLDPEPLFKTTLCLNRRFFACQRLQGPCKMQEMVAQQLDARVLTAISASTLEWCLEACLHLTPGADGGACVAADFAANQCRLMIAHEFYVKLSSLPPTVNDTNYTAFVKRCFQYEVTGLPAVSLSTDNTPQLNCPPSPTAVMSSFETESVELAVTSSTITALPSTSVDFFTRPAVPMTSHKVSVTSKFDTETAVPTNIDLQGKEPTSKSSAGSGTSVSAAAFPAPKVDVDSSSFSAFGRVLDSSITSAQKGNWEIIYRMIFAPTTELMISTQRTEDFSMNADMDITQDEPSLFIETSSLPPKKLITSMINTPAVTSTLSAFSSSSLVSSSSVSHSWPSVTGQERKKKWCSCACPSTNDLGRGRALDLAISVERRNLSSYRRRMTSARDERVSSKALGLTGVACLVLLLSSPLVADLCRLLSHLLADRL